MPPSTVDVAGPSIPLKAVDRFLALDSPLPAMLLMEQRCSFPEAAADVEETRILLRACLLNGRLSEGILRVRGLVLGDGCDDCPCRVFSDHPMSHPSLGRSSGT